MNKQVNFIKMDAQGNDFVIIDAREEHIELSCEQIRAISSRDNKITNGFDQMAIITLDAEADCFMNIYNFDGGEIDACGNITRCVAWLLAQSLNKNTVAIRTNAALLHNVIEGDLVEVNMGKPRIKWQEIPLAYEIDTLHLNISQGALNDPVAVNMGNPHAVFFVDNVDEVDFDAVGAKLEHHPIFPDRANISAAQIIDNDNIKMRIFERGTGETLACGTAACAAFVAAKRRGLISANQAKISVLGGSLTIIEKSAEIFLKAPIIKQFEGGFEL